MIKVHIWLSSFELYGGLFSVFLLIIIGGYFYRKAKQNCGEYSITGEGIRYKSNSTHWCEKLSEYENINWYERVEGRLRYGQLVEWSFELRHSKNQRYTIVFNRRLMKGLSKPECYLKWCKLKEKLGIPGSEVASTGVSIF